MPVGSATSKAMTEVARLRMVMFPRSSLHPALKTESAPVLVPELEGNWTAGSRAPVVSAWRLFYKLWPETRSQTSSKVRSGAAFSASCRKGLAIISSKV
jgi:hypothetical protein